MFLLFVQLGLVGLILIYVISFVVGTKTGSPFIPSRNPVIKEALKLAGVKKNQLIYDLGCGDGRVLIEAARQGFRAEGWEIDPLIFLLAWWRVRRSGLSRKIKLHWGSFWSADFAKADIVYVYQLPRYMDKLKEKLTSQMRPGSKIISNSFLLPKLKPKKTKVLDYKPPVKFLAQTTIYLYAV